MLPQVAAAIGQVEFLADTREDTVIPHPLASPSSIAVRSAESFV
jgi:hypothetical protein